MDATYDPSLPTEKDEARQLLGDTDTVNYLRKDETIEALIEKHGYKKAVIQLALGLAAEYAQDPDTYEADGGVKVQWSERVSMWRAIAKEMSDQPEVLATQTMVRTGSAGASLSNPDTSRLRF